MSAEEKAEWDEEQKRRKKEAATWVRPERERGRDWQQKERNDKSSSRCRSTENRVKVAASMAAGLMLSGSDSSTGVNPIRVEEAV